MNGLVGPRKKYEIKGDMKKSFFLLRSSCGLAGEGGSRKECGRCLPLSWDEQASMIADDETKIILKHSFQFFWIALMEFCSATLRLQSNHFLCEECMKEINKSFIIQPASISNSCSFFG